MKHDLAWNSGRPYAQSYRPLSIAWHTLLATVSRQTLFLLTSLPLYRFNSGTLPCIETSNVNYTNNWLFVLSFITPRRLLSAKITWWLFLCQVIVILIGTNDCLMRPEDTADCIVDIGKALLDKQPQAKIFVLVWTWSRVILVQWNMSYVRQSRDSISTVLCHSIPFKRPNGQVWRHCRNRVTWLLGVRGSTILHCLEFTFIFILRWTYCYPGMKSHDFYRSCFPKDGGQTRTAKKTPGSISISAKKFPHYRERTCSIWIPDSWPATAQSVKTTCRIPCTFPRMPIRKHLHHCEMLLLTLCDVQIPSRNSG